jgi:hypothetical protein
VAGFGDIVASLSRLAFIVKDRYGSSFIPTHVQHPTHDELISEKWNEDEVYTQFREYSETFRNQWMKVLAAERRGGLDILAASLHEMFGEWPVQAALKSLGERTRGLTSTGQIRTAGTGALVITELGRGNPRKTFDGAI